MALPKTKPRANVEELIQSDLITICRMYRDAYSQLSFLFHIPNGGWRGMREAVMLKAMGVERGVPDLFLAWPSKGYHGMFLEMKSPTGRLSNEQEEWQRALKKADYACGVYGSWQTAWNDLVKYLDLPVQLLLEVPDIEQFPTRSFEAELLPKRPRGRPRKTLGEPTTRKNKRQPRTK